MPTMTVDEAAKEIARAEKDIGAIISKLEADTGLSIFHVEVERTAFRNMGRWRSVLVSVTIDARLEGK